jgi:hypothetical protein
MNRLLELAQEAEQSANLGNAIDIKLMMQNYAQLIIQEAMEIVRDEVSFFSDWACADNAVTKVKEHFGIE